MTHITRYRIEGMHCAACVARIEAAIGKLPGVTAVAVNLATNEARVLHEGDVQPDVTQAVESVGYRANELPASALCDGLVAALRRSYWIDLAQLVGTRVRYPSWEPNTNRRCEGCRWPVL